MPRWQSWKGLSIGKVKAIEVFQSIQGAAPFPSILLAPGPGDPPVDDPGSAHLQGGRCCCQCLTASQEAPRPGCPCSWPAVSPKPLDSKSESQCLSSADIKGQVSPSSQLAWDVASSGWFLPIPLKHAGGGGQCFPCCSPPPLVLGAPLMAQESLQVSVLGCWKEDCLMG